MNERDEMIPSTVAQMRKRRSKLKYTSKKDLKLRGGALGVRIRNICESKDRDL
jgi:hypothetical protein